MNLDHEFFSSISQQHADQEAAHVFRILQSPFNREFRQIGELWRSAIANQVKIRAKIDLVP